jgi:chromosomal replication initiator protein
MGKSTLTYQVIPGLKNNDSNADKVVLAVSQILEVSKKDMLSKLRAREAVFARNMCYYIYKHYFGMKLTKIAKIFNRDHTTVIYGLSAFENDVEFISSYNLKYNEVKNRLNLNSILKLPK